MVESVFRAGGCVALRVRAFGLCPYPGAGRRSYTMPTAPPFSRRETAPPGINVTCPHDTHHPVALGDADVAAAQTQVRDLERTGAVGSLTINRVAEPPWTAPGGPPSPGLTILTHSGSEAERRAWQRPIAQAVQAR